MAVDGAAKRYVVMLDCNYPFSWVSDNWRDINIEVVDLRLNSHIVRCNTTVPPPVRLTSVCACAVLKKTNASPIG